MQSLKQLSLRKFAQVPNPRKFRFRSNDPSQSIIATHRRANNASRAVTDLGLSVESIRRASCVGKSAGFDGAIMLALPAGSSCSRVAMTMRRRTTTAMMIAARTTCRWMQITRLNGSSMVHWQQCIHRLAICRHLRECATVRRAMMGASESPRDAVTPPCRIALIIGETRACIEWKQARARVRKRFFLTRRTVGRGTIRNHHRV